MAGVEPGCDIATNLDQRHTQIALFLSQARKPRRQRSRDHAIDP